MPTPHIQAQPGDFAETLLMPGDPLRAVEYANAAKQGPALVVIPAGEAQAAKRTAATITRTISPAEIREAAPSPEWSPNCAMMPKRRRAQSLIVAAEPRSVPAPEAAKPITSAVMLVENFNMLRKIKPEEIPKRPKRKFKVVF